MTSPTSRSPSQIPSSRGGIRVVGVHGEQHQPLRRALVALATGRVAPDELAFVERTNRSSPVIPGVYVLRNSAFQMP